MWGICNLIAGTVRGPEGGRNLFANKVCDCCSLVFNVVVTIFAVGVVAIFVGIVCMWHCERVTFLSSIFRKQIFIHFGNFGHFCICLFICIDVFSYNSFCCNHIFRNSGNKDTNYMLAILDSRMKIVAHERFQYVLLKKFGKLPTTTFLSRYFITISIITDLSKTTKAQIGHYFRSHK